MDALDKVRNDTGTINNCDRLAQSVIDNKRLTALFFSFQFHPN